MQCIQVLARSSLDEKFQQRCLLLLSKICKACGILPTSYILREEIRKGQIHYCGGFADVIKGEYSGSPVAIKRLRVGQGDYSRVFKVPSSDSVHTPHSASPSGCVERSSDGNG
jgi:hypothetical protein